MALYQPINTFSFYRFAAQFIHNFIVISKSRGYTLSGICRANGLSKTYLYNIRSGQTIYPINLYFLNKIAGVLNMTFDEVAFYHLKGCECGCNPLNGDAKGYKHKPAKRKKK